MEKIDKQYLELLRPGKIRRTGLIFYDVVKDEIKSHSGAKEWTTVWTFNGKEEAITFCQKLEADLIRHCSNADDYKPFEFHTFHVIFWVDKDRLSYMENDNVCCLEIDDADIDEFDFLKPFYKVQANVS